MGFIRGGEGGRRDSQILPLPRDAFDALEHPTLSLPLPGPPAETVGGGAQARAMGHQGSPLTEEATSEGPDRPTLVYRLSWTGYFTPERDTSLEPDSTEELTWETKGVEVITTVTAHAVY